MVSSIHQDVPYEDDDPLAYEWTMKAYDQLVGGQLHAQILRMQGVRQARVTGSCPRCAGPILWNMGLDSVVGTAGTLGDAEAVPDNYISLDVPCQCGHHHRGAHADVTGCGIEFRVEIRDQPRE